MQDAINKFIADQYVRCPSGLTPVVDFVGAFRSWCVVQGIRAPVRGEIVQALQAAGFQIGVHRDVRTVLGLEVAASRYKLVDGRIIRAAACV